MENETEVERLKKLLEVAEEAERKRKEVNAAMAGQLPQEITSEPAELAKTDKDAAKTEGNEEKKTQKDTEVAPTKQVLEEKQYKPTKHTDEENEAKSQEMQAAYDKMAGQHQEITSELAELEKKDPAGATKFQSTLEEIQNRAMSRRKEIRNPQTKGISIYDPRLKALMAQQLNEQEQLLKEIKQKTQSLGTQAPIKAPEPKSVGDAPKKEDDEWHEALKRAQTELRRGEPSIKNSKIDHDKLTGEYTLKDAKGNLLLTTNQKQNTIAFNPASKDSIKALAQMMLDAQKMAEKGEKKYEPQIKGELTQAQKTALDRELKAVGVKVEDSWYKDLKKEAPKEGQKETETLGEEKKKEPPKPNYPH